MVRTVDDGAFLCGSGEWSSEQLDLEGLSAHGRGGVNVERKGGGDHAREIEIRTPERGSRRANMQSGSSKTFSCPFHWYSWILFAVRTRTRGYRGAPKSMPDGSERPNPCPMSRISTGTRIIDIHSHLYGHYSLNCFHEC
jgi:hypothetical protein